MPGEPLRDALANTHAYCNGNAYCNCDAHWHPSAKGYTDAQAPPDPAASRIRQAFMVVSTGTRE